MEWKTINRIEARNKAALWEQKGADFFRRTVNDLDTNAGKLDGVYRTLRADLLKAWHDAEEEVSELKDQRSRKIYLKDLIFGAELYHLLEKRGMDVRLASYDAVWMYLGMCVVPEITFERFGNYPSEDDEEFRIPADHYYVKSVRIYLKSLWWYIYLSLRHDEEGRPDLEKTVSMLWNQSTDTIFQSVERAGREGYRVDLYRELIRFKCEHPEITQDDFRKVMVLNTARCQIIEPDLSAGGYRQYVKELYAYIGK